MNRNKRRSNVVNYVSSREIDEDICSVLQERLHVTDRLIERLGLEVELEGHESCVNCLEWSESGRYLASGSDDLNVILWDPFHKKLLYKYPTLHQNNIFSVKFLPRTSDTKIVTGSADYQILALDAVTKETYYVCTCAHSRIKRIATSPDMSDVFWSASEDGLIRQTDLRIAHTCDNEAQNVIINLRNHQGASAEAKCIAINPLRTEMLAVGSNDPYIRLYDRRMIKLTTDYESSEWYRRMVEEQVPGTCTEADLVVPWEVTDNLVKGCVQYFVPGHLHADNGNKVPKNSRHTTITYLSFSPDGRELLANLGNEQVYLFDVTKKHAIRYFSIPDFVPSGCSSDIDEAGQQPSPEYSNGVTNESSKTTLPQVIDNLRLEANEHFKNKDYSRAIRTYNEAIVRHPISAVLYCNRGWAYMKRAWRGDMYAAARDHYTALQLDPDYMKAFFRLTRCFHDLKRLDLAKNCLRQFKTRFRHHAESHHCRELEKDIEVACEKRKSDRAKKNSKNERTPAFSFSETRTERSVLVSLHLGGIYAENTMISNPEKLWRSKASDFEHRYYGHCNATTDIKEANFFGNDGRYIVAGSDDGFIFFWDRYSENNIRILNGDASIVNCVQPHPSYCLLASSGIDPDVRLWTPMPEEGWENDRVIDNLDMVAKRNHKRLKIGYFNLRMSQSSHSSRSGSPSESNSEADESSLPCRPS